MATYMCSGSSTYSSVLTDVSLVVMCVYSVCVCVCVCVCVRACVWKMCQPQMLACVTHIQF